MNRDVRWPKNKPVIWVTGDKSSNYSGFDIFTTKYVFCIYLENCSVLLNLTDHFSHFKTDDSHSSIADKPASYTSDRQQILDLCRLWYVYHKIPIFHIFRKLFVFFSWAHFKTDCTKYVFEYFVQSANLKLSDQIFIAVLLRNFFCQIREIKINKIMQIKLNYYKSARKVKSNFKRIKIN